jgi:hypothetical protein
MADGPPPAGDIEMTGNGPQTPAPDPRDLHAVETPAHGPQERPGNAEEAAGFFHPAQKKRPKISTGKTPDRATKIFKGIEGEPINLAPIPMGRLAFRERPKAALTNQRPLGAATQIGLLGPSSLSASFLKAAQRLTIQGEEAAQLDEILRKVAVKWEKAGYTDLTRLTARIRNEIAAFSKELISGTLREIAYIL